MMSPRRHSHSKNVFTSPYFTTNSSENSLIRKDSFTINNQPSLESLKSHINNSKNAVYYPTTKNDRKVFKNPKTSRIITEFQFKVYDLCSQVTL